MITINQIKKIAEMQSELKQIDKNTGFCSGVIEEKQVQLTLDSLVKFSDKYSKNIKFMKRRNFKNPYKAVVKVDNIKCFALISEEQAYKLKEDEVWDGEFNE